MSKKQFDNENVSKKNGRFSFFINLKHLIINNYMSKSKF